MRVCFASGKLQNLQRFFKNLYSIRVPEQKIISSRAEIAYSGTGVFARERGGWVPRRVPCHHGQGFHSALR
jgi:hypothetical protein